jgi:hypothetical protein
MLYHILTWHSSFYGLLDLLSGTELDAPQNEIVQTAKQSCELLLKVIRVLFHRTHSESDL